MEIKCKNCIYYHATIGTEAELTGHLESVVKPYGRCQIMSDPVSEEEWCGQYHEKDTVAESNARPI